MKATVRKNDGKDDLEGNIEIYLLDEKEGLCLGHFTVKSVEIDNTAFSNSLVAGYITIRVREEK